MDTTLEYSLPYLHPVAVHFPPVLLLLAALAATAWAVSGRPTWRRMALGLTATGAVASWIARATGETLFEAVEGAPEVEALIDLHRAAAQWALWTSVVATLLLVAATVWMRTRDREPLWLRLALAVPVWASAAWVGWAGHLGGLMVWGVPQ